MEWSGRDRFSELPAEILDLILGFLPILQAARIAVLSTFWRDSWFSLSKLCFDVDFFYHIAEKYLNLYADSSDIRDKRVIYQNETIDIFVSMSFYVVGKVLMQHKGPIRKFCFIFGDGENITTIRSRLLEIDQWLTFITQKGVEEIHLGFDQDDGFLLPNCIFSCPTLKKLHLSTISYDMVNAPCVLPNFTELHFYGVYFELNGNLDHTINAPMLEDLSFSFCGESMFYFNINAPKLWKLTIQRCSHGRYIGYLPVNSTLRNMHTLVLDDYSIEWFFKPFTIRGMPPQLCELNVECLKLLIDPLGYDASGGSILPRDISRAFIHLLQICPKLRELHMHIKVVQVVSICLKRESQLSKELNCVAQTLKSLHTLTVSYGPYGWSSYGGSFKKSLCWLEGLLSCFSTLDKFVIRDCKRWRINRKYTRKILRFPRASPKVEIVFIK